MTRSSIPALLSVILLGCIVTVDSSAQNNPPGASQQQQQQQPQSPGISRPGIGSQPNNNRIPTNDDRMGMPEMQRTFFFSGKVIMDDGTQPPDSVVIERVCNGMARPEAYTDSKGRFSFQLGQNNAVMADASTSSSDGLFGGAGNQRNNSTAGMGGLGRQISERDLMGCELRASLAGFRAEPISLAGRRSLDNPDLGTIVLHRLAKVEGFTFSATGAMAPKDARKAYDKGRELAKKQKFDDAEKELRKAVTVHPKYAAAWYELGTIYHQQEKIEDARKAYDESIRSDEKFIPPYGQMARIAAGSKQWEDAANYSERLIHLNPFYSQDAYYLNGIANLNLNRVEKAETSTREALKLDTKNRNPRLYFLLGYILAQKQDLAGATEGFKSYLLAAPNAPDADKVREQLAAIEKEMASRQTKPEANQ